MGARRRAWKVVGALVEGDLSVNLSGEREKERARESALGGASIHFPALPRVAAALFYETN